MKQRLKLFFKFQQEIRNYFIKNDFIEIITPPAVQNPGMEPHIHPFKLYSVNKKEEYPFYLQTSPEFKMKELLSFDFQNIFTLSYSFRDEPDSSTHRFQFLMLEFYRSEQSYEKIMKDSFDLINSLNMIFNNQETFDYNEISVQEIFLEILRVDLNDLLEKKSIYEFILKQYGKLITESIESYSWEDLFFIIFLNEIEPQLKKYKFLILKDYPAQLAALSEIYNEGPFKDKYCKRFEIYMSGLEIGNCFQELTEIKEQQKRFNSDASLQKDLYNYTLPTPTEFYNTLERGLPRSSGIAIGVERLFSIITKTDDPFIF